MSHKRMKADRRVALTFALIGMCAAALGPASAAAPVGPSMVKDINSGVASSNPRFMTRLGTSTTVVFRAGWVSCFTGTDGIEHCYNIFSLWRSNGTAASTTRISDDVIVDGPMQAVGAIAYFPAHDSTHGTELWRTDGTAAGTYMVQDINPGLSNSADSAANYRFTVIGTTLYFVATDGINGMEIWRSDGTSVGTTMVSNVNPSASNSDLPYSLTSIGTALYFLERDATHGRELWRTDGTAAGTALVKDIYPGSGNASGSEVLTTMVNLNGTLIFNANSGYPVGEELWRSDGTAAGTTLIKEINLGSSSAGSSPGNLVAVGTKVLFSADDGVHGRELWRTTGTPAGTTLVKDIYPGTNHAGMESLTRVGSRIFFSARSSAGDDELWASDGTAAGTGLTIDINTAGSSSPKMLTNVAGTLMFVATTPATGSELYRSDGTGTRLVSDIRPGTGSGLIGTPGYTNAALSAAGGTLYFNADSGAGFGSELWRYLPGTTAPVFTAITPPATGTVGVAYKYTIKASGNPIPTFSVASGTLPAGLTLSATTGVLSGKPTSAGASTFQLKASNSAGSVTSGSITISINP